MPAPVFRYSENNAHRRGQLISAALRTGKSVPPTLILRGRQLLFEASRVKGDGTLFEGLALIDSELVRLGGSGDLAEGSLYTIRSGVADYCEYLSARGLVTWASVTPSHAGAWVRSRISSDVGQLSEPALATMHQRRTIVRFAHRLGRQFHVCEGDPTLDLHLPNRVRGLGKVPLTDADIIVGRSFVEAHSVRAQVDWALAEAGGTSGEIGRAPLTDAVQLDAGTVRLPGNKTVQPRTNRLTDWGLQLLKSTEAEWSVTDWTTDGRSGQATTSTLLGRVLRHAGLLEDGVAPASIRQWAGRRRYDETGSVADAAILLGTRSLDTAAGLIGLRWTPEAWS